MKRSGIYTGGIIIVAIGLLFVLSALNIDVTKYIFFPGWPGVVVAICGIWDIWKDKAVPRGIAVILIGIIIFLNQLGLIEFQLGIGLAIVAVGLCVILKTFLNKDNSSKKDS